MVEDDVPDDAKAKVDKLRQVKGRTGPGGRVPPGQTATPSWPVLHHGEVPKIDRAKWTLRVFGLVENEISLDWEAFSKLPRAHRQNDIHCVTHWSRLDNEWDGVAVRDVLALAKPLPEAKFVLQHAPGGWTTNLPMADFDREENLFATHHSGQPLTFDHGWPVRVVVPHLYFWKGAKWVTGIELLAKDKPGFWEKAGYHMRGDPWTEERFR